jgi:hypothetical protein
VFELRGGQLGGVGFEIEQNHQWYFCSGRTLTHDNYYPSMVVGTFRQDECGGLANNLIVARYKVQFVIAIASCNAGISKNQGIALNNNACGTIFSCTETGHFCGCFLRNSTTCQQKY